MAQTMYTNMNKCINNFLKVGKKRKENLAATQWFTCSASFSLYPKCMHVFCVKHSNLFKKLLIYT
jgi:hypothetical protein